MPGSTTSAIEIGRISSLGFSLLAGGSEFFLPFEKFPWFRTATLDELTSVEWPTPDRLYWPRLDIDLSMESVRDPDAYPLVSSKSTER